jgi:Zn-dependent peptidase ImmA (M78 family)/transcriptional regulator with XRE-family HTH domain
MTRSAPSLARAEMLSWARAACRMSAEVVAEKLGVAVVRVHAWESGAEAPTIPQLRRLAEVYKRPLAFFFLPRPPQEPEMLVEYRQRSPTNAMTPELYNELRSAHARRGLAVELAETLNEIPRRFQSVARLDEEPEVVGQRIREELGVGLTEQTASENRDEYSSLRLWRTAVENRGVLVFQMQGVPTTVTRGFSIPAEIYPVIALNPNDALNGRVFTLIHEYVHLALHTGGPCGTAANGIESFCDRVAGAVLLPRAAIWASAEEIGPLDASAIARLARWYGVSEFAVVTRLRRVGLLSEAEYAAHARRLRGRRGGGERESGGGPSFYRVQVTRLGRPFIRLLLHAFKLDALSQRDLGAHLNVRVSSLEKLVECM